MNTLRIIAEGDSADESAWLGRYRIASAPGTSLITVLENIAAIVDNCARKHWIVGRAVLVKLVRTALGTNAPSDEVLSSIINWRSRMGVLSGLICESVNGKPMWVSYHSAQRPWLDAALKKADEALLNKKTVLVRELERDLFGDRSYNTWSATSFVLARLVRIGTAEYAKPDEFRRPEV